MKSLSGSAGMRAFSQSPTSWAGDGVLLWLGAGVRVGDTLEDADTEADADVDAVRDGEGDAVAVTLGVADADSDTQAPWPTLTATLSMANDLTAAEPTRAATTSTVRSPASCNASTRMWRRVSRPEPSGSPNGSAGSPHTSPRSSTLPPDDFRNGPNTCPSSTTV